MTKNIIKTAIAMSLATSTLLATGNTSGESSARLDSLGLNVYQTEDSYNIWANPAYMSKYSSEATTNIRGQNTASVMAGGNYGTSYGAFGLYFGRPSANNTNNMGKTVSGVGFTSAPTLANPTPVNQFDLMYAIGVTNSIDVGVRLSRKGIDNSGTATAGTATTTTNNYSTEYEFEGGVVMKDLGIDASFSLALPNYEESVSTTAGQSGIQSDGAMMWSLQGGYNLPLDEDSKVRINAVIANSSLGSKVTNTLVTPNTSETRADSTFNILTTGTYDKKLNDKTTLFLSSGILFVTSSESLSNLAPQTGKTSSSTLYIPIVGSVEAQINEDWAVRAGASLNNFALYNSSSKEVVGVSSSETSPTSPMNAGFNLGLGYSPIDELDVDVAVRQGVLFGGGNLLAALSSKITATYRFGGSSSSSDSLGFEDDFSSDTKAQDDSSSDKSSDSQAQDDFLK